MKVLLCTTRDTDASEYRAQLRKWGIGLDVILTSDAFQWKKGGIDVEAMTLRMESLYSRYGEEYDVVQFLNTSWEGKRSTVGRTTGRRTAATSSA